MKNKAITSRNEDFAQWFTDIVSSAKLCTYSNVKGFTVLEPNGYALWEKAQEIFNKMFKETGHQNVYFPLLIPESLLNKEKDHVKGFAPEVAWVTHGGEKELEERYCIRPTSEVLFCDYYKNDIKSYRDLPKLYNQWCGVVRWEKEARPLLRGREFLWQEGHTMHASAGEAKAETIQMLNIYKKYFEEYAAIPVTTGLKTEKEKFAGAEETYTIEIMMHNGVFLQTGTSHYFGQGFSKAFDVKFLNKENKEEHPYQTSWGMSTRLIAAMIMVHGDDNGLIIPPKIAPRQVVIIPIGNDEKVIAKTNEINNLLNKNNITSFIDNTDKSPGFKFAEHEVNGIPVRIEIGPRDLEENKITISRRDTREKESISLDEDLVKYINELFNSIQTNLYNKALDNLNNKTYECDSIEEIQNIINEKGPGAFIAPWCGEEACELKIKEANGVKSRCILEHNIQEKKCLACESAAVKKVLWGTQY